MVLLCSSTVMGQAKKRNTTTKRKAKTERAMTEFEKSQKEEYLSILQMQYEYALESGNTEAAKSIKNDYDRVKKSNYYVEFKNESHWPKYDGQYFYKDGYMLYVHFDYYTGEAECRLPWLKGNGYDYGAKCHKRKISKDGFESAARELVNELNEASGFNARTKQ